MYAVTKPWMMLHGAQREKGKQTRLRDWHRQIDASANDNIEQKNREIDLILSKEHITGHPFKYIRSNGKVTPSLWGHKAEARAGDTVYLQHDDIIRGVILTTRWNADPLNGKMSVTSPIGRAIVGRREHDKIRLSTLDGTLEYRIIKIV